MILALRGGGEPLTYCKGGTDVGRLIDYAEAYQLILEKEIESAQVLFPGKLLDVDLMYNGLDCGIYNMRVTYETSLEEPIHLFVYDGPIHRARNKTEINAWSSGSSDVTDYFTMVRYDHPYLLDRLMPGG